MQSSILDDMLSLILLIFAFQWLARSITGASISERILARVDAVLQHYGIPFPPPPSEEALRLSSGRDKSAGIRKYCEQTGLDTETARRVLLKAIEKNNEK